MKQSDFDRLKAVCEKEGFELCYEWPTDGDKLFVVKKAKDIWEGVEFGELILTGEIKKITDEIKYLFVDGEYVARKLYKPSTESAYIDQLKSKCFKRFGEIKEGDRFERDWKLKAEIPYGIGIIGDHNEEGFNYRKCNDALMFRGTTIYREGKWATRVKERVKVEGIDSGGLGKKKPEWEYNFKFKISDLREEAKTMHNKVLPFLASKLEEYLNK